ncbi:hypothetical protein CBL_21440, partial [Carabus blaptoides fortunei]
TESHYGFDCAIKSLTTWAKVSREIISAFPTDKDESDVHLELMKSKVKKKSNEEAKVVAVAGKGAVSDKAIMKYILTRVGDPEMTRSLALSEYDGLQQQLRRMKNYEDRQQQEKHRRKVTKDRSGTFARKASKKPEVLCIEEKKSSEVYKDITMEGKIMPAMIDTGSSINRLKATEYLKLEIKSLEKDEVKLYGLTVETSKLGSFRTIFQIDGSKFQSKVYVVPDNTMSPCMIIGNDILTQADVINKDGIMKEIQDKHKSSEPTR